MYVQYKYNTIALLLYQQCGLLAIYESHHMKQQSI